MVLERGETRREVLEGRSWILDIRRGMKARDAQGPGTGNSERVNCAQLEQKNFCFKSHSTVRLGPEEQRQH